MVGRRIAEGTEGALVIKGIMSYVFMTLCYRKEGYE